MCGRARCTLRKDDVRRACHRNNSSVRTIHMDRYRPTNNVGPGWGLPVLRRGDSYSSDGEEVGMKWGLVPSFTKKTEKPDHYKMESTDTWLGGSSIKFDAILKPCEESDLVWYPVTPAIGKPSFDGKSRV